MLQGHAALRRGGGMKGDLAETVGHRIRHVLMEEVSGKGVREVVKTGWVKGASAVEVGFRAHERGLETGASVWVEGSRERGGVMRRRLVEGERRFAAGRGGVEVETWAHAFLGYVCMYVCMHGGDI